MKATLTTLLFALFASASFAQAPQLLNYQAIAREMDGDPITTGSLTSVQFEILEDSSTGNQIFTETHNNVSLSPTGLFNLKIGSASPAQFSTIPWSTGAKYLKVTINGNITSTATQMLSVPYALFAASGVGTPSQDGQDGVSIISTVNNGNGTYTFNYSNGTSFTTSNLNGAPGTNGTNGTNGANGVGITSTVNNGNGTYTFNYSNGTSFTTSNLNGAPGVNGTNGTNGANGVGIVSTANNGNGTYTFNYSNGSVFTTSNLTGPQGPVGPQGATDQIAIIEYSLLPGANGGGTTNAGQWNLRLLNLEKLNQIPGSLTLNANNILVFQPGQYLVRAFGAANYCDGNVLRLRNTLTNVDEIYGTPAFSRSDDVDGENSYSHLEGVLNVPAINSQYVLEHWIQSNPPSGGSAISKIFGDWPNTPSSVPSVWARLVIQKID